MKDLGAKYCLRCSDLVIGVYFGILVLSRTIALSFEISDLFTNTTINLLVKYLSVENQIECLGIVHIDLFVKGIFIIVSLLWICFRLLLIQNGKDVIILLFTFQCEKILVFKKKLYCVEANFAQNGMLSLKAC